MNFEEFQSNLTRVSMKLFEKGLLPKDIEVKIIRIDDKNGLGFIPMERSV